MKPAVIGLLVLCSASAAAQQAPPTRTIPIRSLSAPIATTKEPLKSVQNVVHFNDGHLLVHDLTAKRLLFFDQTLARFTLTADTLSTGRAAYPSSFAIQSLLRFRGDSAVFTDMSTRTFIVIGPDGTLGRSMAHARSMDFNAFSQTHPGNPGFDAQGRFVYKLGGNTARLAGDTTKRTLDTASILRADLEARRIDTVGTIRLPAHAPWPEYYKDSAGNPAAIAVLNVMPPAPDEWAVLTDGSIAVVRSHDYHIDWTYPDGSKVSSPKMPFDWRRLTDADKQARIDSARRIIDSLNKTSTPYGRIWFACSPGPRGETEADRGQRCLAERSLGNRRTYEVVPTIVFAPLSEMPDYIPPTRPFAVKPDRDNQLWILPTTTLSAIGGGLLYDVVNNRGEIVERVQLPRGRAVAGFGPGGIVYLMAGDRTSGYTIEKTRVIRN